MRVEDPLESWLIWRHVPVARERLEEAQANARASLDELRNLLEQPSAKGVNLTKARLWSLGSTGLAAQDLLRAQDLYLRVFETGGTGSLHLQRSLLHLIAATEAPASVPFWLKLLEITRPREHFRKERRVLAVAALALLAIRRDDPLAYGTLRDLTGHHDHAIRALGVRYLGDVHGYTERPVPQEVLSDLVTIAVHDVDFPTRYQARAVLRDVGHPIPLDNPNGVYDFKVSLAWNKRIYRIVELRSRQTLEDLHFAIQRAIKWDADHLYSFFMNGKLFDDSYTVCCPYQEEQPPWTDDVAIGELGLSVKNTFVYYFDYGDSHQFDVEVVEIRPMAEPGEYPRVVGSRGEAPSQYGRHYGEWQ
jgi:hypothetical protein